MFKDWMYHADVAIRCQRYAGIKLFICWILLIGLIIPEVKPYGVKDITKHLMLIDQSLHSLTKKGLYERMGIPRTNTDILDIHRDKRYVVISHGTELDPIYNYGNAACLEAFLRSWDELCQIPSADSVVRRSVDENLRIELMSKVTRDGYVEGATGIRRTGDAGRYLRLVDAVVSLILLMSSMYISVFFI